MNRRRILWLVSWYPNKYDAFDGDFIQRHAKAAALYNDVHVLFVKQSAQQKEMEEAIKQSNGLTEQIIYLPKQSGFIGKLLNYRNWKLQFERSLRQLITTNSPHLIHVHVPWKAGLMALWAKMKFNIPYVVTEHWGIYNQLVEDNIHTRPFWMRRFLRSIFGEATGFLSVSRYVGNGVNETLVQKDFVVVPNVVDTELFKPSTQKYDRFTFLHVSNMVPLKNVNGIIEAFAEFLKITGADAQLVLVGSGDALSSSSKDFPTDRIVLRGEVPYTTVAMEMQHSHVFVLNSLIENSPCVIGEAVCCGLPVIATAVGGVPELVNDQNGILVPSNNKEKLVAAMIKAWQNWQTWDHAGISIQAQKKYSPASIGRAFDNFYAATATKFVSCRKKAFFKK